MEVNATLQGEPKKSYIRKIKCILVDHFPDKGMPYRYSMPVQLKGMGESQNADDNDDARSIDPVSHVNEGQEQEKAKQGLANLNCIRACVSTNKHRMIAKSWNLDLTYITNRVIACGCPVDGYMKLYRNPKSQLVDFFKAHHGEMLKIYNLCAEPDFWYDL